MVYIKRGRPPKEYGDVKRPVATVKLNAEDASLLGLLARNHGISTYKYVERIVQDRLDEFKEKLAEEEKYSSYEYSVYPPDVDEEDDIEWVEV